MQFLKRISILAIFLLALGISASAQVNLTATGGTTSATYTTVGGAFTAINAGTHTGAITIDITASTTETAAAVLNSTGAGSASYTSVLIRPTADGVTINGSATAASGRGVIELNGADNVTIDGDNPNTAGINSNLTIINNNAAATTYTSVIRIALSTLITSANGNTVRNCILTGSATGQNVTGTTSTTGAANTTYGILVGGGGSTTAATTAPSAITSVSTTIASGQTATNFTASGNTINAVARGIAVQGAATSVATGLAVTNNTIGAATAGSATTVYSMGMTLQGFSSAIVSGNNVRNIESFISASIRAIDFGAISATGTNAIVERNIVNRVYAQNTTTYGAYGIQVALSSASNTTIRNNFVTDLNHDISGGGAFIDTTFAPFGIRLSAGSGYNVYNNSVNLFGAQPGTATATNVGSAAFAVTATSITNVDARNNIFANTQSVGAAPFAYVSMYLPSGGASTMNLTLNNNDYFSGTGTGQGIAQVGGTAGTLYTAANFNAAAITPATNLRAYTSTLSTAGTNDNASKVVDPLFVSNTNLHLGAGSPMINMGASVPVTNDIDRDLRVNTLDIGADETDGVAPPANDIAATAIVTPAPNAGFFSGASVTPQATFSNVGLNAQSNVQVQFTITGPGGYSYSNTQTIPVIGSDQSVTVTFTAAPTLTATGTYTATATVLTADGNSMNNSTNSTFTVVPLINGGTVSVGTGQTYGSLTNSGGVFAAINGGTVTSNITINVASDLTGETGSVALNEIAGGFTVTIKPTGAARTISGSSGTAGVLNFSGTDNVTIDGSLSGASDRSLTITNNAAGGIIYFASGTNGAQNNTVKNVNAFGSNAVGGTLLGIAFAGNTFGGVGVDNDNNRIENNDVRGAYYGIASLGASSANKDAGTVITRNVMPATGAAGIGRVGIYIVNADGAQITQNNIASVANPGSVDTIGIAAGSQAISNSPLTAGSITNANISRNYVGVVSNNATFSSAGIVLASDTSGTNNVVNNMVTGVIANATSGDITVGIYINPLAGSTQNVYNNSVSMTGDRGATASQFPSYALAISADQPVNVLNNVLVNSQIRTGSTGTGGESYAIGFDGPAANTNLTSNYNDLFVSGALGQVGITGDLTTAAQAGTAGTGTNQTTLAAWQTATGEDANSISSDPLFVSATDLHIPSNSPVVNVGTTSAGVTTDYDGQTRDATPDIGADEFVVLVPGTIALSSATYSVAENVAGGTLTIPVNRTGGTDGAVGVTYTLSGGTATGGAACGGTVDYVNTGGTVSFANGVSTANITVTICDDAVFEGNETFNVTLSAPTGGATLGAQSTAVVTITDNEVAQPGTLQFSAATYSIGEAGGTVALTVTRTGGTDGLVGATYALGGGTATGGAACGGTVDYINTGGTVSFANGVNSATINVTICNDAVFEGNETFGATLSAPTGGASLGAQTTATVTIVDDEVAQPGTLQFSAANYPAPETGTINITVNRTGGSDGTVAVDYTTLLGGTATGGTSCAAGVDYIDTFGTLTFANGVTSQTFPVTICPDSVDEPNETINLALANPTGGATIGAQSTATITITDDDVAGTIQFSSATYTVSETGTTATITATRTGGTDGAVTVNYATSNGTATGGASCGGSVDYVSTNGTLTFANGSSTAQTFSVTICTDSLTEGDETVNLALTNPTGGATLGTPNTAVLTITDVPPTAGNVTVNPGNVNYATLKAAIDAINAGTHTGAVTVDINANTTETDSSVLNASGAGGASYTSVIIRPSADGVTVSGPTVTGRGLIELNGADNVTIDGDNPNTTGTNRNLTITNTAANTVTFTSVIRIAVNATTVTSADNNIIRNLNINGSATGRNIATANATAGTENNTYGIIASANASAPTTAPTAIASLTLAAATGATATNLTISNNNVQIAGRGVAIQGSATSVFPGLSIQNNIIGNSTAGAPDQIYNHGVIVNGTANGVVSGNTIYVEGFVGSSGNSATVGIAAGVISANTTVTIEKNKINRVLNENTATWAVHGINLGGGNNHVVQNNFVSNLRNNQVAGTSAFSTTFGLFGIRVGSGTGHKVYHNSVNLFGAIPGTVNTNLTAAFGIVAVGQTGVDVRNNIFVNTLTGGNATSTRNVAVYLPPSGTSAMNLTLNNNDYFVGSDANNRLAQVGVTVGTGEYQIADFDPSSTTPATNFRAYTSTLSAAGTNDNATKKVDPLFVSNTDLHIQATSPMQAMGVDVGVTTDIDNDTRPTTPDIGADEIAGAVTMPGTLQFNPTTYTVNEPAGTIALTVTRTSGTDGAVSAAYTLGGGTATGGAACGGAVDYVNTGGTVSFAAGQASQTINVTICNDTFVEANETFVATLSAPTGGAVLGTDATATVTIVSEDVNNFGTFAISDARVVEGDSGTTNAVFNVTFSPNARAARGFNVSVAYSTANGTATAGVDYTATSGTLNFGSAGTQTITVPVIGDLTIEPNETFFVNLSSPVNATISDPQGVGIIVDTDRNYVGDYDGDDMTDLTVFRPSNGYWYTLQSTNNVPLTTLFGVNGDIPVPGDYDADGRTDIAVFRPSNGFWYIQQSSNFAFVQTQFGISTDKPVQGDYDGDGKTDIAVFRDGTFYVIRSSNNTQIGVQFGTTGDIPVQGDYDGDGKTDYAVFRPSAGTWYVLRSSSNTPTAAQFGANGDKPVVGDFDGDGKVDFTVYRNGVWYILQSLTNSVRAEAFGAATDIPAAGDYDGDGTTDIAVFRPDAAGVWYVRNSSDNSFSARQWGQTGDVPIPAAYQSMQ